MITAMQNDSALEVDLELPVDTDVSQKHRLEEELHRIVAKYLPSDSFKMVLSTFPDRIVLRVLVPAAPEQKPYA